MKKYKYFIVFIADGLSKTGNAEYTADNQIKSIEDIHKIEDKLVKSFNLESSKPSGPIILTVSRPAVERA